MGSSNLTCILYLRIYYSKAAQTLREYDTHLKFGRGGKNINSRIYLGLILGKYKM